MPLMSATLSLFDVAPRYVIDTNVVVAFLRNSDEGPYARDVMPREWELFERLMGSGEIIDPKQVEVELAAWENQIPDMKPWLIKHRHMFRELTNSQLERAKRIVNAYPDYGSSKNYLGDLEVLSRAGALEIAIITLERVRPNISRPQPKIPEVCPEFRIDCCSVTGFLRREKHRGEAHSASAS